MYSILLSRIAEKQLKKLDKKTQARIISAIKRCRIRPYAHVKRLVESPYFRLRAGDYRIIMAIKENRLLILVIEIKHRKKVYK
ncbi:type II toxin-antitoxin system RelE/ParE family toxin [Candidatus Woesearchaeota archaeon]|nr:type II toxin-antitoxin system RelE/ParE family toxin [Candidatus Woesearchaeota archaeon]